MEVCKDNMIGQGNTAEIYQLDDNKILKLFRNGLGQSIIEKEYQNSVSVMKILDCVPKVYEMVDVNDRTGIIYQKITGTDLLKIMTTSIWKINAYSKKFAHYHLYIQKPVKDNMCTVKEKLIDDLNNVHELSDKNLKKIQRYLEQLPEGNDLCHFDFHPGNIMISDKNAFFLDWMTACKGDVCADVARTCILLKYGEVAHAPWIMKKIISIFQHHIYKIYVKEYLKISKKSMDDITQWELPVAAARLREWITDHEKQVLIQLINDQCDKINS